MEKEKTEFIEDVLDIPDHSNELSEAEMVIENYKIQIQRMEVDKTITDKLHGEYYEAVILILDYVGRLSQPLFTLSNVLEDKYTIKFKHSPELGKKLWLDHYENIHKPYNLLKNRCFRLLDLLDSIYINKFKTTPSNWKI